MSSSPARAALSERQTEVLRLIAKGLTNPQIAAELYVSVNSVKTFIRHAYRKIGVESRSQAVAWVFNNGLITVDPHPGSATTRSA